MDFKGRRGEKFRADSDGYRNVPSQPTDGKLKLLTTARLKASEDSMSWVSCREREERLIESFAFRNAAVFNDEGALASMRERRWDCEENLRILGD